MEIKVWYEWMCRSPVHHTNVLCLKNYSSAANFGYIIYLRAPNMSIRYLSTRHNCCDRSPPHLLGFCSVTC